MTEAIPSIAPRIPWYIGRLCNGAIGIIMTMTPEKTPEDPDPAIARPRMNAVELDAAPHRADPASKRNTATRKTILLL